MLAYGLTNKLTHDPTILLRNGEGLDDEDRDLMERLLNRFYPPPPAVTTAEADNPDTPRGTVRVPLIFFDIL